MCVPRSEVTISTSEAFANGTYVKGSQIRDDGARMVIYEERLVGEK